MKNQRQNIELAEIFKAHYDEFLQEHSLCAEQSKALHSIIDCRSEKLGGHAQVCDNCGQIEISYNSCRNRNCPKCQYIKKEQWVDKIGGNLPPVRQFHIVFTIPSVLHKLFYLNQAKAYNLLIKAAWETLSETAKKEKYFGAEIGAIAVLHTWGQTLSYHPHIHFIVPAGGLDEDHMQWKHSQKNFFLDVKLLSVVFRGKLYRLLKQHILEKSLILTEDFTDINHLRAKCYEKKWVVNCEKPFSDSDKLLKYLGNYTNRIAITNGRLLAHNNNKVTFSYKDYKYGGIRKMMTLTVNEFMRRFFQHVLPCGFTKIRYFGFLSLQKIKTMQPLLLSLIDKATFYPKLVGLHMIDIIRTLTGYDPIYCKHCKIGIKRSIPYESIIVET